MGFQIQQKSIMYRTWVIPHGSYLVKGPVRAANVSALQDTIVRTADEWPFDFAGNFRIVTDRGDPVSRWKVWSGRVKRLRRRY